MSQIDNLKLRLIEAELRNIDQQYIKRLREELVKLETIKCEDRNYVSTLNEQRVHFIDLKKREIKLNDIFYCLARMPRYTCHTEELYSVGQHSLHVASYMNGSIALVGLLHDAAEYVFNDLASPIVAICHDYKRYRDLFQDFIYKKYLPENLYKSLAAIENDLKTIDLNMYATEEVQLRGNEPRSGIPIQGLILQKMKKKQVELELHRMYHHYLELASA